MRRALGFCRIQVVAFVAVVVIATTGSSLHGDLLSRADAEEPRPLQWDDATLRRLLRDAVHEAVAVQDKVTDLHRSTAFDTLASAQASVGDPEGSRATRELAVQASLPRPADGYEGLKIRAFDLARANKTSEAARAYKDAVRIALDTNQVEPPRGRTTDLFLILADGRMLASILNRARDPEAARQVLLEARAAAENETRGRVEWAFYPVREQVRMGDVGAARASLDAVAPQIDALSDPIRRLYGLKDMAAVRWLVGDKETAGALCKKALELGRSLPRDVHERSYPMHLPMLMLATVEDYEGAFRIIEEVPERLRYWALSQVVQSIGQRAGVDRNQQQPAFDSPIDRETAKHALRLAAKVNQALQVKDDPFASAEDRYTSAAAIIDLQARLNDSDSARATIDALAVFRDSKAASVQAKGLVELALAEAKAGRRDESNADFHAALVAAESLPERGEEWRGTRDRRTTYPQDEAKGAVVVARAELGDFDRAIEAAGRIHDPARKADVLASASRARSRVNDAAGALVLAKAPGHGFPAIPRLIEIADDQARTGDVASARATLRFALTEATNYLEKNPQDPTIPPYGESPALADRRPVHEGPDRVVGQHASAAFELAKVRARLGDIAGAHRAFESVHNERWRERVRDELLVARFWSGDAPGAFTTAFGRTTPSERLVAIQELCRAIRRLKLGGAPR
jgi:hypothetical protein